MGKQISTDEIKQLATQFGYEVAAIKAVLIVESSNAGFDPHTGKIKIQFEPTHFKRAKIDNGVDVQSKEWLAFDIAYAIDPDGALMATSWGLGQIMGENHKLAGYATVSQMVNDFKVGEFYQLKGMLKFIVSQRGLNSALKYKDWAGFAELYNGKSYKKFNYDTRLAEAYKKAQNHV